MSQLVPSEVAPIGVNIVLRNHDDFLLDEVQLLYGAPRSGNVTIALRFYDDVEQPEMIFDPYGKNERVISPGSLVYDIHLSQAHEFLEKCQQNPEYFMRKSYRGGLGARLINATPEDSYGTLEQTKHAVVTISNRHFGLS